MAVKRARGKRRGIRPGLERHKIKGKPRHFLRLDSNNHKLCGIQRHDFSRIAEVCFKFLCYSCCSLAIIPMKYKNRELVATSSWKRRIIHTTGVVIIVVIVLLRIIITIAFVHQNGLTVETLMTMAMLIPYMLAASVGAGNVFMCTETLQLVKSWKYTLQCLERASGRYLSGFEDIGLSLKVIAASGAAIVMPLVLAALPFVYPDVPLSIRNVF